MANIVETLPGAEKLITWMGCWPSFHDAEILSLELNREGVSLLQIHTWNLLSDVDGQGFLKTDKHCIVTFLLEEIFNLEFVQFNHQNVIFGLEIDKQGDGYRLTLSPCYGLAGFIDARSIRLKFDPGIPRGSMYQSKSPQEK
jgi:hypothetical protein